MAIARKCDACGKLYDGFKGLNYSTTNKEFRTNHTYNGLKLSYIEPREVNLLYESQHIDLCPDCMQKLIELITPKESDDEPAE